MSAPARAHSTAFGGGTTSHYGGSLEQRRVDAIQAEARKTQAMQRLFRPAPPPPPPLEPTTDQISLRIAEEIDYAKRLLANLSEDLIANPLIVHKHAQSLQSFDLVAQRLGHLAKVIGSADRDAAIDRIGMDELRARLKRKPLVAPTAAPASQPATSPEAPRNG